MSKKKAKSSVDKSPSTKTAKLSEKTEKTEKKLSTEKKVTSRNITLSSLKKLNLLMAFVHAAQAAAVLILASPDKGLQPISTTYLNFNKYTSSLESAYRHLFDVNLAWLVAAFFAMSAIAHLFVATVYRPKYESDLKNNLNRVRWYEYSLSASTMMLAIAMLSGIFDLSSLLMIFALDFGMNMMGLVMETHNRDVQSGKSVNWLSYKIGSILGIIPWVVFGIYVFGSQVYGSGVPGFVYWIYLSIFIFFNCFAINMWLQYRRKGKWADYLYGERTYIILSLVAKSLLAWQVFAGTLRP